MYYAKVTQISQATGHPKTIATFASTYHSEIEEDIRRTLVNCVRWSPLRENQAGPFTSTAFAVLRNGSSDEPLTSYYCAGRAVIAHDQQGRAAYRLVRPYPAGMLASPV